MTLNTRTAHTPKPVLDSLLFMGVESVLNTHQSFEPFTRFKYMLVLSIKSGSQTTIRYFEIMHMEYAFPLHGLL